MSGREPLEVDWDRSWLDAPALATVLAILNPPDGGEADGDGAIETRVVGGAVRNALLNQPAGDIDLATTAPAETVMALARAAGLKAVPTGIAHGTVTVICEGAPFEVTTLRHDVETHGRHATVAFGADWVEDARRRDFTMNALYADRQGRLYDPVGGYGDVFAGRVRFIGDANARIAEDFLRILRFFRFHAQYGHGDPDAAGLAAVIRQRNGLLGLSAERLRQEMLRLIVARGAASTVRVMAESAILGIVTGGITYLGAFSRASALETAGVEGEDGPDAILRLAALCVVVAEDVDRLAGRLRLTNAERKRLTAAASRWWAITPALSGHDRAGMLYRIGRQTLLDRARLSFARFGPAPNDPDWQALLADLRQRAIPRFPVTGGDLVGLGLASGPAVGALLERLETQWIEADFALDREALLLSAAALIQRP